MRVLARLRSLHPALPPLPRPPPAAGTGPGRIRFGHTTFREERRGPAGVWNREVRSEVLAFRKYEDTLRRAGAAGLWGVGVLQLCARTPLPG